MIIRCPNTNCNTKMAVKEEVLRNPDANVKCPSCKERFKPFDRLPQSQKDDILHQQKTGNPPSSKIADEETDILDDAYNKNRGKTPVGWLVVHDENTRSQTYNLFEGKQIAGRKSTTRPCDIMIETNDKLMSRNHFVIEIRNHGGRYSYALSDSNSKNKTYVETKVLSDFERQMRRLQPDEELYIEDGAIIQAGQTKIVFKSLETVNNKEQATQIVSNQKITKTVIL